MEVDQTFDELTAELTTAREGWADAKGRHDQARREETDRGNEELKAGKRYNVLLDRLNKEFGVVKV